MQSNQAFETELAFRDNFRRERNAAACDAHLGDLVRVYGAPLERVQPVSYCRRGPMLPGAAFPQREVLASLG